MTGKKIDISSKLTNLIRLKGCIKEDRNSRYAVRSPGTIRFCGEYNYRNADDCGIIAVLREKKA